MDRVRVTIRVRPLISSEIKNKETSIWNIKDSSIYLRDGSNTRDVFTFDDVLDEKKTNADLYSIVRSCVLSACEGFNATIFAYGQTSSGKTHSIMGSPTDPGVLERAADDLFNTIENDSDREFLVQVSFFEIYNERIRDLLDKSKDNLKIRECNGRVHVEGCETVITTSKEDFMAVIKCGNKNRHIGDTKANTVSSRSHAICHVAIESTAIDFECLEAPTRKSHLYIVDLAGSERAAVTGATGERLQEGCHINKSLLILTNVITQCSRNQSYVNFRDSKLTRILSNALDGNSKIQLIANVTPASESQTLSTLNFARSAKNFIVKPVVNNITSSESTLQMYKLEAKHLQEQLSKQTEIHQKQNEQIENLKKELIKVKTLFVPTKKKSNKQLKPPPRRHTMCATSAIIQSTILEEEPVKIKQTNLALDLAPSAVALNETDFQLSQFHKDEIQVHVETATEELQEKIQRLEEENEMLRRQQTSTTNDSNFLVPEDLLSDIKRDFESLSKVVGGSCDSTTTSTTWDNLDVNKLPITNRDSVECSQSNDNQEKNSVDSMQLKFAESKAELIEMKAQCQELHLLIDEREKEIFDLKEELENNKCLESMPGSVSLEHEMKVAELSNQLQVVSEEFEEFKRNALENETQLLKALVAKEKKEKTGLVLEHSGAPSNQSSRDHEKEMQSLETKLRAANADNAKLINDIEASKISYQELYVELKKLEEKRCSADEKSCKYEAELKKTQEILLEANDRIKELENAIVIRTQDEETEELHSQDCDENLKDVYSEESSQVKEFSEDAVSTASKVPMRAANVRKKLMQLQEKSLEIKQLKQQLNESTAREQSLENQLLSNMSLCEGLQKKLQNMKRLERNREEGNSSIEQLTSKLNEKTSVLAKTVSEMELKSSEIESLKQKLNEAAFKEQSLEQQLQSNRKLYEELEKKFENVKHLEENTKEDMIKIEELTTKLNEKTAALAKITSNMEMKSLEIESLKQKLNEATSKEQSFEQLLQSKQKLYIELEKKFENLKHLEENTKEDTIKIEELTLKLNEKTMALSKITSEMEAKSLEIAYLKEELNEATSKEQSLERQLQSKRKLYEELEKKFENLKHLEESTKEDTIKIEELTLKLNEKATALSKIISEMETKSSEIKSLKQQLNKATSKEQSLEQQLQSNRKLNEELEKKLENMKYLEDQATEKLQIELENNNEKVSFLNEMISNLTKENKSLLSKINVLTSRLINVELTKEDTNNTQRHELLAELERKHAAELKALRESEQKQLASLQSNVRHLNSQLSHLKDEMRKIEAESKLKSLELNELKEQHEKCNTNEELIKSMEKQLQEKYDLQRKLEWEHQMAMEKIKDFEGEWQERLDGKENELKALREELQGKSQLISKMMEDAQSSSKREKEFFAISKGSNAKMLEFESQLAKIQTANAKLMDNDSKNKEIISNITKEKNNLQLKISELIQRIKTSEETIRNLRSDNEMLNLELKKKINSERNEMLQMDDKMRNLHNKISDLEKNIEELKHINWKYTQNEQEYKKQIKQSEEVVSDYVVKLQQLREELKNAQFKTSKLNESLDREKTNNENLKEMNRVLKSASSKIELEMCNTKSVQSKQCEKCAYSQRLLNDEILSDFTANQIQAICKKKDVLNRIIECLAVCSDCCFNCGVMRKEMEKLKQCFEFIPDITVGDLIPAKLAESLTKLNKFQAFLNNCNLDKNSRQSLESCFKMNQDILKAYYHRVGVEKENVKRFAELLAEIESSLGSTFNSKIECKSCNLLAACKSLISVLKRRIDLPISFFESSEHEAIFPHVGRLIGTEEAKIYQCVETLDKEKNLIDSQNVSFQVLKTKYAKIKEIAQFRGKQLDELEAKLAALKKPSSSATKETVDDEDDDFPRPPRVRKERPSIGHRVGGFYPAHLGPSFSLPEEIRREKLEKRREAERKD